jgi:uncharacterized protein YoxC
MFDGGRIMQEKPIQIGMVLDMMDETADGMGAKSLTVAIFETDRAGAEAVVVAQEALQMHQLRVDLALEVLESERLAEKVAALEEDVRAKDEEMVQLQQSLAKAQEEVAELNRSNEAAWDRARRHDESLHQITLRVERFQSELEGEGRISKKVFQRAVRRVGDPTHTSPEFLKRDPLCRCSGCRE